MSWYAREWWHIARRNARELVRVRPEVRLPPPELVAEAVAKLHAAEEQRQREQEEEEALVVIERALTGSRFAFNETLFRQEARKRLQQGINTANAQIAAVGASPNRFDRLQEIQMPTLIIHGTEDPLIPIDHGLSLAENIPNAAKMILQGVGHEIPEALVPSIATRLSVHFNQVVE